MYLVEKRAKQDFNDEIFMASVEFLKINMPIFATTCEIWATSFKDEGNDYCEYRFFDKDNKLISTQRANGY